MKTRGFTLIQLIVVLAVISTLAGFFSFKYQSSMDKIKLQAAAKLIAADIRAAQARAVSLHEPQSIEIRGGLVATPRTFKFAPSGLPYPGYSGTVVIKLKNEEKKIILSPAGRTRVE